MPENEILIASMRLIDFDDIQLLRYWRNLDHVRNRMIIKNLIHRDEQRKWFDSITNESTRYFIFSLGMNDIGCANLKEIDFYEKTFEGGIFCGDAQYLNHWINIWACLQIYDHAFFKLKLATSYATILIDNKVAVNLNEALGYEFVGYADGDKGRFTLTRSRYIESTEKIRRYLHDFAKQPA